MQDDGGLTRREALAGAIATSVVIAGDRASAQEQPKPAQATATGTVFEDPADILQPGPDSKGIPGVLVSNGRDIVRTDAQGRYEIAIEPGQSVFVVKPPGYGTLVKPESGLAHFAYVYEPAGSPSGFRYKGVAPTGDLPGSIDFPLRSAAEPPGYDVILFTDPQPETLAELGYVRDDVVERLAGIEAAFGIVTGDLMFDDLSFYGRYNRLLAGTGLVFRSVPGNHDINVEAPDDVHSRDTWKRVFGARHYAFQYGGTTYVMLDNVQYLGPDPAKPGQLGKYRGYFGPEQIAFVRNLLAEVPRDSLVVYCFHIPLRTIVSNEPNNAAVDGRDFLAAISTHPKSVSFCGHTHTNEHHYLTEADGFAGGTHHHHILAAASGSWWSGPFDVRGIPVALQTEGCPNGFHILSIDNAEYSTRLVPTHDPHGSQIRLMLDSQMHRGAPEALHEYRPGALLRGPIMAEAVGSTRLVANLFDGGPRSALTLVVGGGEHVPMQRVERNDPWVEEVYLRNADTKKPWVNPGKSSHLWVADLPATMGAGTHRLEVRATDEFEREHVAVMLLEITGNGSGPDRAYRASLP